MPVMGTVTGETLEHCQIRLRLRYKKTWNQSYSNELGILCQGIVKGYKRPKQQHVEGTDTFRIIQHKDIPHDRHNEITYTKFVFKYRAHEGDLNLTRITIGVNRICYPGDVGTPTGSLELFKLIISSVLSRRHVCFFAFDVSNVYLATSMDRPEFVRIRLEDIPQEFIDEYNLTLYAHNR